MRIAYADPPYLGQAKKHYQMPEVDHVELIEHLQTYDGWALSCSSPSLRALLPLCPPETRIAAWVKPFAIFKPGVNPAYAWEPVLYVPARKTGKKDKTQQTVRDWVSVNITLKKGLVGVKPEPFCMWLFYLLALQPDDDFIDVFPGSGAVTVAFEKWRQTYGS